MGHSILSLQQDRFDTRLVFGGCLININGETFDCELVKNGENFTNPTYTVINKENNEELCTFRPYHMNGGPLYYEIEGASQSGGSATLIVPEHGMLSNPDDDYDMDEDSPGY